MHIKLILNLLYLFEDILIVRIFSLELEAKKCSESKQRACQNGGTCKFTSEGGSVCLCAPGYYGIVKRSNYCVLI